MTFFLYSLSPPLVSQSSPKDTHNGGHLEKLIKCFECRDRMSPLLPPICDKSLVTYFFDQENKHFVKKIKGSPIFLETVSLVGIHLLKDRITVQNFFKEIDNSLHDFINNYLPREDRFFTFYCSMCWSVLSYKLVPFLLKWAKDYSS